MVVLPDSPALSDCDSLNDISESELEALLQAQGELSRWPTPPPKDQMQTPALVKECDLVVDERGLDALCDGWHSASPAAAARVTALFATEASLECDATPADHELVYDILSRFGDLPLEVLAIAFNIIQTLNFNSVDPHAFVLSVPSDLIVVSALSMTLSYVDDRAPSFKFFARDICDWRWTPWEIETTAFAMLKTVGWELRQFCTPAAIKRTLTRFAISTKPFTALSNPENSSNSISAAHASIRSQRTTIDSGAAIWKHGQVTPEGSKYELFDVKPTYTDVLRQD